MRDFQIKDRYDMEDYRALMHFLRSPEGCPWDRVQTHESIRRNLLEEAYETAQAIDTGDRENLREELGDLLMQVLFHAEIEADAGGFGLDDIADAACKKLVFRHPHVFGDVNAADPEAVLVTWDEQKKAEKGQKTAADTLAAVAETLPSLWRAEKLLKKAEQAGIALEETENPDAALELAAGEITGGFAADPEDAVGRLLFAAVQEARSLGVDPETALHKTCGRFISRFAEEEQRRRG